MTAVFSIRPSPVDKGGLLRRCYIFSYILFNRSISLIASKQTINMLIQILLDMVEQWIQDKINSFSSCHFGCWYEITVPRNQNDSVHLLFIGQR